MDRRPWVTVLSPAASAWRTRYNSATVMPPPSYLTLSRLAVALAKSVVDAGLASHKPDIWYLTLVLMCTIRRLVGFRRDDESNDRG
jgi:hypothetical protein